MAMSALPNLAYLEQMDLCSLSLTWQGQDRQMELNWVRSKSVILNQCIFWCLENTFTDTFTIPKLIISEKGKINVIKEVSSYFRTHCKQILFEDNSWPESKEWFRLTWMQELSPELWSGWSVNWPRFGSRVKNLPPWTSTLLSLHWDH